MLEKRNGKTNKMANKSVLILAGVGKAGTSSLFLYLSQHPSICASNIKEINYFAPLRFSDQFAKPIDQYLDHFSQCSDREIYLEASPGYFFGNTRIPKVINSLLPNAKIIIILREPVSRIKSFFNFYKSHLLLENKMSFSEYINEIEKISKNDLFLKKNRAYWGLEECLYDNYLNEWIETFTHEKMKILFFENFVTNIDSTLEEICEWLGIESRDFISNLPHTIENRSTNYRYEYVQKIALHVNKSTSQFWRSHPTIKNLLRSFYYAVNGKRFDAGFGIGDVEKLNKLFKPHNTNLAKMLWKAGYRNLPEWLLNELGVIQ